MGNTFYNLCNVKYGIAERNYLSPQCIKLQIFCVLASPSIWEVWSLIPGLFKLDTVSPATRHFCNVYISSVVRSCVGQTLSCADDPRHLLHFLKTYLRFLMTLKRSYKKNRRLIVLATNRLRLKVVIRSKLTILRCHMYKLLAEPTQMLPTDSSP